MLLSFETVHLLPESISCSEVQVKFSTKYSRSQSGVSLGVLHMGECIEGIRCILGLKYSLDLGFFAVCTLVKPSVVKWNNKWKLLVVKCFYCSSVGYSSTIYKLFFLFTMCKLTLYQWVGYTWVELRGSFLTIHWAPSRGEIWAQRHEEGCYTYSTGATPFGTTQRDTLKCGDENKMTSDVTTDDPKPSADVNEKDLHYADEGFDVDMAEDMSMQNNKVNIFALHSLYLWCFRIDKIYHKANF